LSLVGDPAREVIGYQKSTPIMSGHKSMPVAGRWFPALGIRHKSRDSSYLSRFKKARISCSNAILSGGSVCL
jgi:hypothetical protein